MRVNGGVENGKNLKRMRKWSNGNLRVVGSWFMGKINGKNEL